MRAFSPRVEQALNAAGYTRRTGITQDHIPPGTSEAGGDWVKWFFRPPDGARPTNVHMRVSGRGNQRYALLFRDYLRAGANAAQAHVLVKQALARLHPDDKDACDAVKDPVCDIIMATAEQWAEREG